VRADHAGQGGGLSPPPPKLKLSSEERAAQQEVAAKRGIDALKERLARAQAVLSRPPEERDPPHPGLSHPRLSQEASPAAKLLASFGSKLVSAHEEAALEADALNTSKVYPTTLLHAVWGGGGQAVRVRGGASVPRAPTVHGFWPSGAE
jgi:hypothetical protein